MDARQCRYLIKIAECGSISKASEELFISQSGLNQQLVRIENSLGVKIFERNTHYLKATEAGEIILDFANDFIKKENQMMNLVKDTIDGTVGEIRINLAMEQGVQLFGAVYPEFHRTYPNVYLRIADHTVSDQYSLLMKDELDIGMVMISKKEIPEFEYVHLAYEKFLLGIPEGHPLAESYDEECSNDYPEIDLRQCRDEYFSLMFSGSTMRQVIDPCFEAAGFAPKILFESRTNHIVALMASNGICLTILPESQARLYEKIKWFRMPGDPEWESCLIYNKDNPPRRAGRYFIELAQEYASRE